MDPVIKNELLSVVLDVHKNVQNRVILDRLKIKRFVVPERDFSIRLRRALSKPEQWR